MANYTRRKSPTRKFRTIAGYTRADGTRVKPYTRAKVKGRKFRTVKN